MTVPKRALLAAMIAVLAGVFALAPPALLNSPCPDSGTLTWSNPAEC